MNTSTAFVNTAPSPGSLRVQMKEIIKTFVSAAVLGGFVVLVQAFSSPPNVAQMRRCLLTFITTSSKLAMFICFGQIPLRHSGFIDCFSLTDIVGVAGFGGLGLSIFYVLQERFNTTPLPHFGTPDVDHQSRHRHVFQERIKLDRALQEKITLLFVCEIYHTIAGVILGVFAMRSFELSYINQAYFDILMFSGFLGPLVFFSWFVLMTVIVFGIMWVVRSH